MQMSFRSQPSKTFDLAYFMSGLGDTCLSRRPASPQSTPHHCNHLLHKAVAWGSALRLAEGQLCQAGSVDTPLLRESLRRGVAPGTHRAGDESRAGKAGEGQRACIPSILTNRMEYDTPLFSAVSRRD